MPAIAIAPPKDATGSSAPAPAGQGTEPWTDYRSPEWPNAIKIEHHKTGATVWHPLQDEDGTLFYADAEAVLAKLPRRGIPKILREIVPLPPGQQPAEEQGGQRPGSDHGD